MNSTEWNTSQPWKTWNGSFLGLEEEPKFKKITQTLAYCLLLLVSLIGNILIIWAISRDKRLRTNTNILIANMAVSDLLFPVFTIPQNIVEVIFDGEWLIDGDFGLTLCKLLPYFTNASWTISIYSCVFIAIDRYHAVAHPFRGGFSRSKLKFTILGVWIFAVVSCIPYLSTQKLTKVNYLYEGKFTRCEEGWNLFSLPLSIAQDFLMYFNFAVTSGIPFPVTMTLYLLIVLKLRKHKLPGQQVDSVRIRREKQNKKVLKMAAVIVALTFGSWIFLHSYLFLLYYGKLSYLSYSSTMDLFFAAYFISLMTCSYNFFIYLVFNDMYRTNFKAILGPFFSLFRRRNNAFIAEQEMPAHGLGLNTDSNIEMLGIKRTEREV